MLSWYGSTRRRWDGTLVGLCLDLFTKEGREDRVIERSRLVVKQRRNHQLGFSSVENVPSTFPIQSDKRIPVCNFIVVSFSFSSSAVQGLENMKDSRKVESEAGFF